MERAKPIKKLARGLGASTEIVMSAGCDLIVDRAIVARPKMGLGLDRAMIASGGGGLISDAVIVARRGRCLGADLEIVTATEKRLGVIWAIVAERERGLGRDRVIGVARAKSFDPELAIVTNRGGGLDSSRCMIVEVGSRPSAGLRTIHAIEMRALGLGAAIARIGGTACASLSVAAGTRSIVGRCFSTMMSRATAACRPHSTRIAVVDLTRSARTTGIGRAPIDLAYDGVSEREARSVSCDRDR